MADFEVSVRTSYRDIARLVLDCGPGDFELTTDRRVKQWINRAPLPRVAGGPRFGNPSADGTARPRVDSGGGVVFVRSGSQYLKVLKQGSLGAASQNWTVAFEFAPRDHTGSQVVLASDDSSIKIWSENSVNYGYETSAGFVSPATGELPGGVHLLACNGGGTLTWYADNTATIAAGAVANFTFPNYAYIGRDTGTSYLDGVLRSMRVWNRVLSSRERDLAYQTLGIANLSGLSPDTRALVAVRAWTDGTGQLSALQSSRVNPDHGQQQTFRVARLPAGQDAVTVQLACETDGTVLPDAQLAGALYSLRHIERASPSIPVVSQDGGWSSVFDVRFSDPGHYTMLLERTGHGSMYVHLDVEQV